jgi:hypothetical protein
VQCKDRHVVLGAHCGRTGGRRTSAFHPLLLQVLSNQNLLVFFYTKKCECLANVYLRFQFGVELSKVLLVLVLGFGFTDDDRFQVFGELRFQFGGYQLHRFLFWPRERVAGGRRDGVAR